MVTQFASKYQITRLSVGKKCIEMIESTSLKSREKKYNKKWTQFPQTLKSNFSNLGK